LDDSISDPLVRDSITIKLNPSLASHALNVRRINLNWWIGDALTINRFGINRTIHSVMASKYRRDIRRWE
jgi:hypothetical protein